jgi:hypothetical protein
MLKGIRLSRKSFTNSNKKWPVDFTEKRSFGSPLVERIGKEVIPIDTEPYVPSFPKYGIQP